MQQAEQGWNKQVTDNDTGIEDEKTPELVLSDSESEEEADMFSPRRTRLSSRKQPLRRAKRGINYKGMFDRFSSEANISPTSSSSIYQSDMMFLSTLDLTTSKFKPTSVTCALDKDVYLSKDSTYENTPHPLVFTAKVQFHQLDSPTYSDIRRGSDNERKLWDYAMIKELQ